jgi:pimeloyl-ACP methyl ester carboxylesterase
VLEPFQGARGVGAQVDELAATLRREAAWPVVLMGWSWGAWLGFLTAAEHPSLVRRLVLVSSPPFEASCAERILPARLARLDETRRREAQALLERLAAGGDDGGDRALSRLADLFSAADDCERLPGLSEDVRVEADVYRAVWAEAAALRASGALLERGRCVRCPVLAVHGDVDPHPAAGVEEPLRRVLADFRFVLLERCGHEPWAERHAAEPLRRLLVQELARAGR